MPEIKRRSGLSGMVYVGIDPGQKGGIAVIDTFAKSTELTPMPDTEMDICNAIKKACQFPHTTYALIEGVHSMPGQGVASSFKFGMGYGGLRMALTASAVSFDVVSPQKWQKALGVKPRAKTESKDQFKKRLRGHCQRLYPKLEGITLATADALLIATYLQRKHEGRL